MKRAISLRAACVWGGGVQRDGDPVLSSPPVKAQLLQEGVIAPSNDLHLVGGVGASEGTIKNFRDLVVEILPFK